MVVVSRRALIARGPRRAQAATAVWELERDAAGRRGVRRADRRGDVVLPPIGHLHANVARFGQHATETPLPLRDSHGQIVFPGFPADVLFKFRLYSVSQPADPVDDDRPRLRPAGRADARARPASRRGHRSRTGAHREHLLSARLRLSSRDLGDARGETAGRRSFAAKSCTTSRLSGATASTRASSSATNGAHASLAHAAIAEPRRCAQDARCGTAPRRPVACTHGACSPHGAEQRRRDRCPRI